MLGYSSFSIRQFDWFEILSIACELYTKIGTVRDPSEYADASKVATRCRSDARRYMKMRLGSYVILFAIILYFAHE